MNRNKVIVMDSMVELISGLENKALNWIKEHIKIIFWDVFLGIIIYFMMISGNLVNCVDGIWNTSQFIAGAWETSIGRGLLYFFDKLRSGLVSMPLNGILTIFLISVSSSLILDLYLKKEKGIKLLASLLLIASPVTSIILSHCYMSVDFGIAFLFSVIAVRWICSKYRTSGIFVGGIFIALSMGCYQAYFGVTCLLLLLLLVKKILEYEDWKKLVQFIIRSMLAILFGGVLYIILANILLLKYNINLSSYRGASEVSIGNIITSFPMSIVRCYQSYYDYFVKYNMYLPVPHKSSVLLIGIGILILYYVANLFLRIWKKNRIYALCFCGGVCLIPVASSAILLIVQGTGMILLMSMSLMASPILCLLLCVDSTSKEEKIHFFTKRISYLLLFLLLWVEVITVTNDQLALKEGKEATKGVTDIIVSELASEGYLEDGSVIAFFGRPSENRLFAKRRAWEAANSYAKFGGNHWLLEHNDRRTWIGFLAECYGLQLNFCTTEQYKALLKTKELAEMPIYPAEGAIREINGVVVVKVSDMY